ncbi:MAG: efflux RND transporter periplasmic adaptor subunit, partial [Elusimicrobiota bacterium]|nr:efflux RND transporter periplasmic adaptor subunit [Elusimicrobiota bacterium]
KDQSSVYPEAEGRLSRYLVSEGDKVNKDQIIAQVDREMIGMDFEKLRVRAPVSGTVTRLYHSSGDTVSRQTPLAVIAKLDEVKVAFHIPEKDLQFVSRGNPVMLTVSSRPGKTFSGSVERISLSLDKATRSAYAEALFKNSSRSLMPGMFAEIEVISRKINDALLVPENTILRDPLKNYFFVFTVDKENKSVKQAVETGQRQDGLIRILSGLKADDRVVFEGQDFLKEGESVRIIK